MKRALLIVLFLLSVQNHWAQSRLDSFLKPADSLQKSRRNAVVVSQAALSAGILIALNQTWYADYPRTHFHTINDNAEWLQMDKAGHVFSAYHLGSFGKNAWQWSGASRKSQLLYGASTGFAFLSVVEFMDGYSSNWGASLGDVAANAAGTGLFLVQELAWSEQRIIPKFSFHTTPYASARPSVLGSNYPEQLLKDYNGQTYWLSVNLHSFAKNSKIPTWLNVALGYGAEGMITGNDDLVNTVFLPESERFRQFYLSFDVDLTKIKTKSHVLKTVFEVFNTLKIPAPTLELTERGDFKFRGIYF
ncbi:DUF2279 domain-containing protein [Flavobacterium sp. CYK-55]|uniref:DUF2279 domain-containing protein n=1 Tax=Flavobacterium sp. CYK-55 TaxID=2835529 RepID=UPI001BCB07F2|nr:DUF2279 domain-containing protein [Flavobacterium sp. CYK-55]MBS7787497.1 DUF2279 domain-containing protein [Flavobacterium sp. CYK-55]